MDKAILKKEFKKLFKSMDYVSDNYLSKRKVTKGDASAFYNIYQQLGLLWEFLSYQCRHWNGYIKKANKFLCKICGRVKGTKEKYYLLPLKGRKIIGRMIRPGRDKFEGLLKKEAEIVNDTIKFHGAKLNVSVFNGYISKLGRIGKEIKVAADRVVTLEEDGLIIDISKYITGVKIKASARQRPIYGGFVWELPKRILKKMPIILSYNKNGKLTEIELIR